MNPAASLNLFSYRKYWAHKLTPAPFLPMSAEEMAQLEWDSCDIIIVTGDAYVDHPSFGMAIIGRLLEAQGFRVGIIAQPDWSDTRDFQRLGKPNLFFGVTSGNMDSMVNRYTSERKMRSDDAYTPHGIGGRRPDRSTIVYTQRCHEAYPRVPVILGGIEASLRRLAHFDYWQEKVRRSILLDAKADLLVYGNAERAIVEIAHRLAVGEPISALNSIRGTVLALKQLPKSFRICDETALYRLGHEVHADKDAHASVSRKRQDEIVCLPSYDQVSKSPMHYAHASRILHQETNPGNARVLIQEYPNRWLWVNPPPWPLGTPELDRLFELPYQRIPHPAYGQARIPAYEMIRFSINIMRGCFGGCTFCSITEHEGRIIQNRSIGSILKEIEVLRDQVPGFTGVISDLGGPTANMWRLHCREPAIEAACRRLSCVYPQICPQLNTNQRPLIDLYRQARALPGIKQVFIASGLRYDLALREPEYIQELVTHHVGGYLKIAPEHSESDPLSKMMKPPIDTYNAFKKLFDRYSQRAGKEQYLIPYFIAAHPGSSMSDMLRLALWLKAHDFRLDQVQSFLPTPMALATTMWHTGYNPLKRIGSGAERVESAKGERARRLQKAFIRYHDPANWPILREALRDMGRSDLIGNGKRHLVPAWQPQLSAGKTGLSRTRKVGSPAPNMFKKR